MAAYSGPRRTWVALYLVIAVFFVTIFVGSFRNVQAGTRQAGYGQSLSPSLRQSQSVDETVLSGHAIAPKLGNETAKAELGRAAWKLFHTTFARFPDKPTQEESSALKAYIHLFQRLYPCGECASHFGAILDKFPPQVSSRSAAAAWGCHVHNQVNKSLKKDLFDCSQIGDFYDCGCAGDESSGEAPGEGTSKETKGKNRETQHRLDDDSSAPLRLEKEE